MITNQRLRDAFALFLTPSEAEIAAAANGQNSANSNDGKQSDREFFQDLLQPIGRN